MLTEKIIYLIKNDLDKVELLLKNNIDSEIKEIPLIYNYALKAGGKRLRPALVLLSARLFSDRYDERFIKLSMASEIIHMASLIHDDVIDDNSLRRGTVTANYKWGNKSSVFVADFMLLNLLVFLLEDFEPSIVSPLFTSISKMCEGELLQIKAGYSINVEEDSYIQIIERKTATLLAVCCEVGARAAHADEHSITALSEYGRNIGIAFQIIDDLMDLISTSQKMGKERGNDLRDGKITLPLIRTFQKATFQDRERLKELINHYEDEKESIKDILNLVYKYEAVDYCIQKSREYIKEGMNNLKDIKACNYKELLMQLGEYIISRAYN